MPVQLALACLLLASKGKPLAADSSSVAISSHRGVEIGELQAERAGAVDLHGREAREAARSVIAEDDAAPGPHDPDLGQTRRAHPEHEVIPVGSVHLDLADQEPGELSIDRPAQALAEVGPVERSLARVAQPVARRPPRYGRLRGRQRGQLHARWLAARWQIVEGIALAVAPTLGGSPAGPSRTQAAGGSQRTRRASLVRFILWK